MDVFGLIAMPLGTIGFVFGISALAQLAELKKQVLSLEQKLENMTESTDKTN
ncbi:MAG: hypothetical protein ACOX3R_14510 [Desulfitobacteriia bacterium]|jgi:hypothetical protein